MSEGPGPPARDETRRALRRLRMALVSFASAGFVGGPWDMLYHITNPFDSFFSPPHLFIYGTTLASIALVASLARSRPLRESFGAGIRLPGIPAEIPPPLVLLGSGLFTIVLSGILDALWHGAFGLDETRWSTPHALFGWGLFATTLGFSSARLALRASLPVAEAEQLLHGVLIVAFSLYAFLLPFMVYPTRATLDTISNLPVIQAQPPAQHTFRIYTVWNVTHSNALFPALGALWAGTVLAVLGAFAHRTRTLLTVSALASAMSLAAWYAFALRLGTASDPREWLPLPLLPSAAVLVLLRRQGPSERVAQWVAAAVFAVLVVAAWGQWGPEAAAAILSLPSWLAGASIGQRFGRLVQSPTRAGLQTAVPVVCLLVPALFGALDLYLRLNTA